MTTVRYVYAVCRPFGAALQSQLTGVAGAPPRLLRHHDLVAVVGHVPEAEFSEDRLRAAETDTEWLAGVARLHQGVVDALTTVTTPLPLRPATVFRDDSAVRLMMELREDELRRSLDRLEGRVEWGVRVFRQEAAEGTAEEAGAGTGEAAAEEAGAGAGAGAAEAGEISARLHKALAERADASHAYPLRPREPGGTGSRNVLNAAYLVPRAHAEEFVEIVDRVRSEEPGILVELSGPSAAYSFATEDG
ncbi:GvpL/GvpF family gas vesicle protein [Streptomyces sp. NPDC088789]|uniref:GvpL/GvpF family gas vesicle protein n=1 Tax=Streptomyces sp. NPDC088789 TaxID=3365899 RepID=UPI00382EB6A1